MTHENSYDARQIVSVAFDFADAMKTARSFARVYQCETTVVGEAGRWVILTDLGSAAKINAELEGRDDIESSESHVARIENQEHERSRKDAAEEMWGYIDDGARDIGHGWAYDDD